MLPHHASISIAHLTHRYRADLCPEGRGEAVAHPTLAVVSLRRPLEAKKLSHTNEGENHD